jgi:hypothetical protein
VPAHNKVYLSSCLWHFAQIPPNGWTSDTLKTLSYLFRLLNYIAANTPTIANKNSKPGIDAGVGEIVGLGIKVYY